MYYGVQYLATRDSAASPSASTETAILLLDNDTAGNSVKQIKYVSASVKGLSEGEYASVSFYVTPNTNGSSVTPAQISEFELKDPEAIPKEPSSLPAAPERWYTAYLTDYQNIFQLKLPDGEAFDLDSERNFVISVYSTVSNLEYQAVIGWED